MDKKIQKKRRAGSIVLNVLLLPILLVVFIAQIASAEQLIGDPVESISNYFSLEEHQRIPWVNVQKFDPKRNMYFSDGDSYDYLTLCKEYFMSLESAVLDADHYLQKLDSNRDWNEGSLQTTHTVYADAAEFPEIKEWYALDDQNVEYFALVRNELDVDYSTEDYEWEGEIIIESWTEGDVQTNTDHTDIDGFISAHRSEEYKTLFIYRDKKITIQYRNPFSNEWSSYCTSLTRQTYGEYAHIYDDLYVDSDYFDYTDIAFAVKTDLSGSGRFSDQQNWIESTFYPSAMNFITIVIYFLVLLLLAALMIRCVMVLMNTQSSWKKMYGGAVSVKRRGVLLVSKVMYNILLEVKVVIAVLVTIFALSLTRHEIGVSVLLFVILGFLAYADLSKNRKRMFDHSLYRHYREFAAKYPFQKKAKMHTVLCVSLIFVFGILTVAHPVFLLGTLGCMLWLYLFLSRTFTEMGMVVDQITKVKEGGYDDKLELPDSSLFIEIQEELNNIQEGMQAQLEELTKSEKMKIELITNVSHDLKTPLTSMINYIELLKGEELLPDYANDYVSVIEKKTKRLNQMVQDLFDVAKANSGNLEIQAEKLDVSRLLEQAMAELEKEIADSNLEFKLNQNIPDEKVYILADGKHMARVVENILNNAIKYSLKGTRVYIDIINTEKQVNLIFKNISNYEMNFSAEEVAERFVRGDESRTKEGSGLGLSIVKSFVEMQNGEFNVYIDGDMFKVIVGLPKAE